MRQPLGELLETTRKPPDHYKVYVVRAGEMALYVGKTKRNIQQRLRQHFSQGTRLAVLYWDEWPASAQWTVEMVDPQDCVALFRLLFGLPVEDEQPLPPDWAELALIRLHEPLLNEKLAKWPGENKQCLSRK